MSAVVEHELVTAVPPDRHHSVVTESETEPVPVTAGLAPVVADPPE